MIRTLILLWLTVILSLDSADCQSRYQTTNQHVTATVNTSSKKAYLMVDKFVVIETRYDSSSHSPQHDVFYLKTAKHQAYYHDSGLDQNLDVYHPILIINAATRIATIDLCSPIVYEAIRSHLQYYTNVDTNHPR